MKNKRDWAPAVLLDSQTGGREPPLHRWDSPTLKYSLYQEPQQERLVLIMHERVGVGEGGAAVSAGRPLMKRCRSAPPPGSHE